jgi:galactose mutarotase-like enzyme
MNNQYNIQSEALSVTISAKGAELISVKDKKTGFEFIWDANPSVWNRHAPVLFPIVGKLNNNTIKINGKHFEMNQHGFARDLVFEPIEVYGDLMKFMLESNDVSLAKYPYQYRFFITYQLTGNSLKITYCVYNLSEENLYFSVGAHPGFKLPIPQLDQYFIEFEKPENLVRHLLSDGLLNEKTEIIGLNQTILPLSNQLFLKDAIVFKDLKSSWLKLVQTENNYAIKLNFEGFPFMGIWTKVGQEAFLCLEPWQGIADKIGFEGEISAKEGIQCVTANETLSFDYELAFFAG